MSAVDILIPCKSFARGKSRLAEVLKPQQRAFLCRWMFERTLAIATAAAKPTWRVAVVSDDAEVLDLANKAGALQLIDSGDGSNQAVRIGVDALKGGAALLVLSADLPTFQRSDLEFLETPDDGVTLVPDHHGSGTNAVLLPARAKADFCFSFGPGSLDRHTGEAARLAFASRVIFPRGIVSDLDDPADLAAMSASLPDDIGGAAR